MDGWMDGVVYFIFHGRLNLREFYSYGCVCVEKNSVLIEELKRSSSNNKWLRGKMNNDNGWLLLCFKLKVHVCVLCTRIFFTYMAMWHSTWKKSSATLTDLMNESVIFWCTEMSVLIMIITIIKFGECHLHTSTFECNLTELNQSTKYEWLRCPKWS